MRRCLLSTWPIDVSEDPAVPIITTIRPDIPLNWVFIATIIITSNKILKFHFSYQIVIVFFNNSLGILWLWKLIMHL